MERMFFVVTPSALLTEFMKEWVNASNTRTLISIYQMNTLKCVCADEQNMLIDDPYSTMNECIYTTLNTLATYTPGICGHWLSLLA